MACGQRDRTLRRRQHHAFYSSLPQGEHGRHGRDGAASARGCPRRRQAPRSASHQHPLCGAKAGQADSRAQGQDGGRGAECRRAGGPVPTLPGEASHQGEHCKRGRAAAPRQCHHASSSPIDGRGCVRGVGGVQQVGPVRPKRRRGLHQVCRNPREDSRGSGCFGHRGAAGRV